MRTMTMIELEQEWRAETSRKVALFREEVVNEDPEFVRGCVINHILDHWAEIRLRILYWVRSKDKKLWHKFLLREIDWLRGEIAMAYSRYDYWTERDLDYPTKQAILVLYDVEKKEKQLKKIQFEMDSLFYQPREGQITEADIQRARDYPIEDIVGKGRGNMVRCINHSPDNHPSMSIKGNFAYCFTCGYTGDSIDLTMRTRGLDFIAAVKFLTGK